MNRLILLTGPPGTGKTTLSQGLAQKLSIRLNKTYDETKLIQINAATLLSKFFSESAKYIIQIFTAIERMCKENPKLFICVLIDEIESLASSRLTASIRGEVQDGIRATNALLTGFDMVKSQTNLIILCTSNMIDTLDVAFVDRCGYQITVDPPSLAARYQILRNALNDLITSGVVTSNKPIPQLRDAQLTLLSDPAQPGSQLIKLCEVLEWYTLTAPFSSAKCSARSLGQLPEVALAASMMSDTISLTDTLRSMTEFVTERNNMQQQLRTQCSSLKRKQEEQTNG